jgi:deoxyribose-phosphate aldolase
LTPIRATQLARRIDHAALAPALTRSDLVFQADACAKGLVRAVCVAPRRIKEVAPRLAETSTKLVGVIAYPAAASYSELVVREAERAVREGAVELDIVLPWGLLVERRFSEVLGEVREISVASGGIPLKLIVEASEMDDDLLGSVIHEIVLPSGAAFLKTGTGVFNKPLSSQQIRRLRQRLPTSIGLKVSGGLRSAEAVLEAFEAGADVVGTSRTLDILEALATAGGQL